MLIGMIVNVKDEAGLELMVSQSQPIILTGHTSRNFLLSRDVSSIVAV